MSVCYYSAHDSAFICGSLAGRTVRILVTITVTVSIAVTVAIFIVLTNSFAGLIWICAALRVLRPRSAPHNSKGEGQSFDKLTELTKSHDLSSGKLSQLITTGSTPQRPHRQSGASGGHHSSLHSTASMQGQI